MAGNILKSGGRVTVVPVHPSFGSHLIYYQMFISSPMHLHDCRQVNHLYKHFVGSKEAVAFFLSVVLAAAIIFSLLLVCLFACIEQSFPLTL